MAETAYVIPTLPLAAGPHTLITAKQINPTT